MRAGSISDPDGGIATNTATDLETYRNSLYERLEEGYDAIERGLAEGDDITAGAYEGFWIALLREYERVCNELQAAV